MRRRPRCQDGTLDLRFKVNIAFDKNADVTDYYDPMQPKVNIKQRTIDMLEARLKSDYDKAKFGELQEQLDELKMEVDSLKKYEALAAKYRRDLQKLVQWLKSKNLI